MNKDLHGRIEEIPTVEDFMINRRGKRSKSYIPENDVKLRNVLKKVSSKNSVGTSDHDKSNISNRSEANTSRKSSKERNSSMRSYQQQDMNQSLPAVEKPSRLPHSSFVTRVKKIPSRAETNEDSHSNKSTALWQEENEILPASISRVHVVKLPRNKVSAYSKPREMTATDSTVDQRIKPNGGNNDIFGEVSLARIDPKLSVKNDSFRSTRNGNSTRQEKQKSGRHRSSSFNGVDVRKIKRSKSNDKVGNNHPQSAILSKYNKIDANNRVTVISVMKLSS